MIKTKLLAVAALLILICGKSNAQLAGTYSVPATYSSISAAINALNTSGVSAPVTILVDAGYTETVPAGGYTLTATGTSANPIRFQKNGVGANPLLTAYSGGVGTPGTAVQDGVWRFQGSDYITIDGIDIVDPNTANPATMEFGYGFFKASATNGCQNDTIKNCVITLNRINNIAGSGPAVDGSRGIDVVNALMGTHTTAVTVTSATGTNSNNKFYSNTIQNCNVGIALIGFAATTPFTNADQNNDIGGNSIATGNTIINYGGGTAANPAAAVRTLAQYGIKVSFNAINNNNGAGLPNASTLRGIYLNTATSANATVSNNTITMNSGTTTSQVSAIENVSGSTAAGNAITISNNLIANGTSSTTSGTYYGIYNNAASSASLVITNNTFTNNTSNVTSGATYLIRNSGAVTSFVNISNNTLSHTFSGTVAASGSLYNIYTSGTGTVTSMNISNNTFAAYNHLNVTGTGGIYYIYNSSDCNNLTINSNNWNNLTINNSALNYCMYNLGSTQSQLAVTNNTVNNYIRNAASGTFYGYYGTATSLGTAVHTFSNNIFSNITSTITGAGSFYGLYNTEGNTFPYPRKTVYNNTITNVNYNGTGTMYGIYTTDLSDAGTSTGSSVYNNLVSNITCGGIFYGLYNAASTSTNYITNVYTNTVSNITGNGAGSAVYGSYVGSSGAGINFYKNKIYDITTNGATGTVYGVYAITSTTSNIFNNLVGNLYAPFSGGTNKVNGIFAASGTNLNFYYNTVYLNGTSAGTDFGTNAIYTATSVTNVTLRNNIFVNLSTPTGTGTAVAYRRNGISLANYNASSNDNLFYAGTPSASNLIFSDGTNNYQTFSTFVSAVAPNEGSSITENPTFQSTTGSSPNFLNINTTVPTQIESSGNPIIGITDDYAGNLRNVTTPDIGAWEGNYTLSPDISAPAFLTDGFVSSACNLTARSYTINMTDVSGVASGSLAPRVYYKVNNGPYTSVAGSLTSGSALNGVWTFNLTYSGNIGDVISYFVVAQDVASTPNLDALPGGGFAGTSVNNVTSNPTNPFTYTLSATLNGTYTVGSTGNFTTLTQAANAYNTACLTGPVTYVLIDPSYSANETFPIIFTNNADASNTNSLLIIPAASNQATVTTGTTYTSSTLKFLNARYITLDGLNTNGSSLTVSNTQTSTAATAVIWMASTPGTGPGNNTIGIKRLSINSALTTSGKYGILAAADAANPVTTTGPDNDNIVIVSNTITTVYYGIYGAGTATVNTGGNDGWLVTGNQIGTSSNNIGFRGMFLTNVPAVSVTNNNIQNIFPGASGASGIYLSAGINAASVSQNTISNITSTVAASGTSAANGIYVGSNVLNSVIEKNTINGVRNTNASGYAGRGIIINTANSASGNRVVNNMISDIGGTGDASALYWPIGIALEGSSGGVNIEFNTVNLDGSMAGLTTATASAAMYVNTTGANNIVRNNILVNTYNNTAITTDAAFGVYSSAANGANISVMDYNDYYAGGTGNVPVLGYVGSANRLTLAAMQAGFGGNLNSKNIAPVFVSATDLHMQAIIANSMLDDIGTPVATVTVDIDNQVRNVSTPDIGADEFSTPTCTSAVGGTITPASYSLCNGQSVSLTSNSLSAGSTTIYQWMSSATQGGPYTNVTGGSGANGTTYNSAALSTGTLYYVLQVVCSAGSMTATSNEATVAVNPIPTATATSNSPLCAGQTLNLTGGTDIGTNFTWTGPNTFSSSVQNPIITNAQANAGGNYTLVVSAANCSSAPVTLSVTVNSTSLNILSNPNTVCMGNSSTLTAVGNATSYVWSNSATTNSIVVTPANTTTYSVAGTGTTGCTAISIVTISVSNPTITGTGASTCAPGTNTLTAIGFAPVSWYASPTSTVALATGTAYIPPTAAVTTTYYAEAASSSTNTLFVSLGAGNSSTGTMFDIVAQQNININGFDVNVAANNYTVEVWYRPGSYVGFNTSNVGWTMAGTTTITGLGSGIMTPVPMTFTVPMTAGQTYGFYVTLTSGTMYYTNGTAIGALWASNSDLQLLQGHGGSYFNLANSPRCFNGQVRYSKPGCTSPKIPVILTVNPSPTVSASASTGTVCPGNITTLTASGATTYSWNVGAITNTVSVSPSVSTIYTVTGTDNNGCSNDTTVSVSVFALPSLSLTASQTTVCVNGSTVTLTGSPAGGIYSGSNVSQNVFTPGSISGTFSPVYSYTDTNTGCSDSTSVTIIVSTCTGLDAKTSAGGLSVYPNPNNGEFVIELGNSEAKTIELSDLTGRVILSESTTKDKINVNISGLANGVYFVKIKSAVQTEIIKVIKQ